MSVTLEQQRGVRPVDAVLAALLLVLAGVMAMEDITAGPHSDVRIDSHSAWHLLLVLLATAPVLLWRRGAVEAALLCGAGYALDTLLLGYGVRCGAGLPLTFVLAFLTGLSRDPRERLAGLGASVALGAAVLWQDTAAGITILPVVALVCLVLWFTGSAVAAKTAMSRELVERTAELTRLRDERAALEVAQDRERLSGQLQGLLDERLESLSALAERSATSDDPEQVRRSLVALEEGSRDVLTEMREVVGRLRGGEQALSPLPSVASLEALVVQRDGRLTVRGEPRVLQASVELSAYRIVEHVLDALGPENPAEVSLGFQDDALEVRVVGAAAKRFETKAALARAAERARLHSGAVRTTVARGRASVLATLPIGV